MSICGPNVVVGWSLITTVTSAEASFTVPDDGQPEPLAAFVVVGMETPPTTGWAFSSICLAVGRPVRDAGRAAAIWVAATVATPTSDRRRTASSANGRRRR